MARLSHQPALDGLRGVAVAMVVATHTTSLDKTMPGVRLAQNGYLGVDVFFVLSGFLIASLLLNEWRAIGRVSFKDFYLRRARRLLPALVGLLGAFSIYAQVTGLPRRPVFTNVWSSLLYVRNYVTVTLPARTASIGLGHLWSLSVEEQFYVVFPALLVLMLWTRRAWVAPAVIAAGIVALELHRAAVAGNRASQLFVLADRTEFRADGLLIGALAALAWHYRIAPVRAVRSVAWCAVPVCLWIVWRGDSTRWMWRYGWPLFYVATACIVLGCMAGWAGARAFTPRPLQLLGRVSYGLYLWHLPIFAAVNRYHYRWSPREKIAVAYLLAAIATAVSYRYVERPFRRAIKSHRRRGTATARCPTSSTCSSVQPSGTG